MNKFKSVFLSIVCSLLMINAKAQLATNTSEYKTAIGLRAGGTSGLTIKHFVSGKDALEGIVSLWGNGISGTLLYERHETAFEVSGLNWYYGLGGHVAINFDKDYNYDNNRFYYRNRKSNFGIGVDGIFGLEYKVNPAPIAISLDLKPFIEFDSDGRIFSALDAGLGLKLTF